MSSAPGKVKHYQLLSELAPDSGTYLARDERKNRQVTLKELRSDAISTDESLKAYRKIVKELSRNKTVPVARTVELLQTRTGQITVRFLVREYRDGKSLDTFRAHSTPLSAEEAAGLAARTARALSQMHQAGVIHGNLCSTNVILQLDGTIQLVDYGFPGRTANRPYLSPECFSGHPPSATADLFALGVIYCRLLSGEFPPAGSLPEAALRAAGPREDILMQLLEPNPSRRISDAAEVASLLENPSSVRDTQEAPPQQATDIASTFQEMLSPGSTSVAPPPVPKAIEQAPMEAIPGLTPIEAPVLEPPTPAQAPVRPLSPAQASRELPEPSVPAEVRPKPPEATKVAEESEVAAQAPVAVELEERAAISIVDWDRVLRLVAERKPVKLDVSKALSRLKRPDASSILKPRSSEAASPVAPTIEPALKLAHSVLRGTQGLFAVVVLGFVFSALLESGGQDSVGLQSSPDSPPAVYNVGVTQSPSNTPPADSPPADPAPKKAVKPDLTPSGTTTTPVPLATEMRTIPAGDFVYLNPATNRRERISLLEFSIDRYEVTNAEFLRFTRESGQIPEGNWQKHFVPGMERHPVVGVSYRDAQAYASWAGKRLPTAAEWQKAAGGPRGYPFPWGLKFDALKCAWLQTGKLVPVDAFSDGQSPYGAFNMAGNVWEWVSTRVSGRFLVMGGSFQSDPLSLGTMARQLVPSSKFRSSPDYGFRCAK